MSRYTDKVTSLDRFDRMICKDKRKCFAKTHGNRCNILNGKPYKDGECPFCKADKHISLINGKEVYFSDKNTQGGL